MEAGDQTVVWESLSGRVLSFRAPCGAPHQGPSGPTVALMAKARSRLPAVMLKVRSALHPLSASLARMWATKLETGLFSLMVTFMGRFSSTGSLSLMSSTRIPTSIWGMSGEEGEGEEVKEKVRRGGVWGGRERREDTWWWTW